MKKDTWLNWEMKQEDRALPYSASSGVCWATKHFVAVLLYTCSLMMAVSLILILGLQMNFSIAINSQIQNSGMNIYYV